MRAFPALVLLLLGVTSCASLSRQECLQGAWYQVGLDDGVNGHSTARLSDHAKACARVGVRVDAKTWEKGRRDGLKTYCTASSAYQVARKGRHIGKVCTAAQRTKMQPAYDRGTQYFEVTRRINELDGRLREARSEIGATLRANNGSVTVDVFYLQGEIFDLEQRIKRLELGRQKYSVWP